MKVSLVVPNRNNLKYFKWMYDSVRKNQGEHEVYICSAVDACTDGTLEYYEELAEKDPYFSYIVNHGPERLGHTILYDQIIRNLVKTELAAIWHCDMYLCPGALDAIEDCMYSELNMTPYDGVEEIARFPNAKTIVSLTRIEPPLHPNGPEKILADFGTEPENFDEVQFLNYHYALKAQYILGAYDIRHDYDFGKLPKKPTTEGIFAPWFFWVDEFKEIGGHNPVYAPQSKEDCIIHDTLLLVEIDGSKKITTPNKLWEIYNEESYTRDDGKKVIDLRKHNIKTISAYPDGSFGLAKLNGLIRKETETENLVKVRTNWGEVVVTKDHSLLNKSGNAVKAENLEAGNIWEPLFLTQGSFRRNLIKEIDFNSFVTIEKNNSILYDLPNIENIDEYGKNEQLLNICEFLGFFVAEGSTSYDEDKKSYYIHICENNLKTLTYFKDASISLFGKDIWDSFFVNKKENFKDVFTFTKGSKHLSKFMRSLVGSDSKNKKVPDFIFNIPKVYQKAFLYGYLKGDGYLGTSITKQNTHESFSVDKRLFFKKNVFDLVTWKSTSKSKELTFGINYLLRLCFPDIKTRIHFAENKGLEGVWNISTCKFYKKDILEITPFVSDSNVETVYDLEVRNTNTFVGGVGLVGLHNSDIFDRFHLNDTKFIQTWEGFVYHMTCRGSRRNTIDGAPNIQSDNPEWLKQNVKSTRNFIRMWGTMVKHDKFLKPIVPPKFNIGIVMDEKLDEDLLPVLEIYCDSLYTHLSDEVVDEYSNSFLADTNGFIDVRSKIKSIDETPTEEIIVSFLYWDNNSLNVLDNLSQILEQYYEDFKSDSKGVVFEVEGIRITINSDKVNTYEKDLIVCKNKIGYFDEEVENKD